MRKKSLPKLPVKLEIGPVPCMLDLLPFLLWGVVEHFIYDRGLLPCTIEQARDLVEKAPARKKNKRHLKPVSKVAWH